MKKSFKHSIYSGLLLALFIPAYADNFTIQSGSSTFQTSHDLQRYVNKISTYKPETTWLKNRLVQTEDYYKKVHILKTVHKNDYTIDCVPFSEQPSLINNQTLATSMLPAAEIYANKQLDLYKRYSSYKSEEFNPASDCPLGSVALLRPDQEILTLAAANKKGNPYQNHSLGGGEGYTWQVGPDLEIPSEPNRVGIIPVKNRANVVFGEPQKQFVTDSNRVDHSLDQLWVINGNREVGTFTAEAGIIDSKYFTFDQSLSYFVFASVDNYGSRSCYNLSCPNFVQLPNSYPLGAPLDRNRGYNFRILNYTYTNTSGGSQNPCGVPGYYISFSSPHFVDPQSAGCYPKSIYNEAVQPSVFSAGAEIYGAQGNGTVLYGNFVTANNTYGEFSNGVIQTSQVDNFFPYSYGSNGEWHLGY